MTIGLMTRLPVRFIQPSEGDMSNQVLTDAIVRAEQAMSRLEQTVSTIKGSRGREEKLRATVRGVVAELDSIFASGGR